MKFSRGDGIFFAVLACAVAVVFGSSLFFTELIFDDIVYVGRFHLLSFSFNNLKLWWQPVLHLWSPLVGYSFMLDYFIWGKEHFFFGAHLVNILLHFIAAAGFYTGLRLLKFSRPAAGLAVLVWTIHPQRAESVVWLSERKDVLLLVLGLWGIVFFMQSVKRKKTRLYVWSVIFFALSFCIKPALIGLPLVLTAYLWGRYRKTDWRFYVKYSGIFWLISFIYYIIFKCVTPAGNLIGGESLPDQLILMFWRYGSYLTKTFVPCKLNPMYPHFSLAENSLVPLYAAGLLILLLLELLRRRNKKALYIYLPLFLSYSAAVAPGLFQIGDVDFADRYSYFPSVFVVLATASFLCTVCRNFPQTAKPVTLAVCCLTVFWGSLCYKEVFVWQNHDSYVAAILSVSRPNYRRVISSAVQHLHNGNMEGVVQCRDQLKNDYNDGPAVRRLTINLFTESLDGVILVKQGNVSAGSQKILTVLSHPAWRLLLNSSFGYPRYIMLLSAGICQRSGRKKDAVVLYKRLAEVYGTYEPMEKEFYLALAALCQDDRITALRHFENARKLNPTDENIRKNIEILKKVQTKRH